MYRHWIRHCFVALALAACWLALIGRTLASQTLALIANPKGSPARGAASSDKHPAPATDNSPTATLGGPERYLTALSTDKPFYRAGEKVYVRGVLLNAANHKPLSEHEYAHAVIEIKGPKGETVAGGEAAATDSIWGFAWEVPAAQAGGEYTIKASYPNEGYAPTERKFDVRAYRAPRLKSQITFLRDGYGPGEKVQATLDVKRAEGGIPEGAKVTVDARVDGQEIKGGVGTVDANGLCSVSFDLPREIPRGEGTLALIIEDGGVVETASKTIPIILQTVDLQIYPEGGDLLAGYKNRVYIQAKQPNGKPADLAGKLMEENGTHSSELTKFHTEHEGRGRFEFSPKADSKYYLSISTPAGIKTVYYLPKIKSAGAVIRADKDFFKKDQPVTVQIASTEKKCHVILSKREVEIKSTTVDTHGGKGSLHPLAFDIPGDVDGVLTVTVSDMKGNPLAERLLFREPSKSVHISVTPTRKSYIPGDKTELKIKSTDDKGKPVSAVVGLTVTDDSVLELVEKREQAPHLPVMVFLEPEVKDLADAHVYLDEKNPNAPLAVDLLLGTQGWRRFGFMQLAQFMEHNGDAARRVVAFKAPQTYPTSMGTAIGALAGARPGAMRFGFEGNKGFAGHALNVNRPLNGAMIVDDAPMIRDFREDKKATKDKERLGDQSHLANAKEEQDEQRQIKKAGLVPPPPALMAGAPAQLMEANAVHQGFAFDKVARRAAPFRSDLIAVREFAHEVRPNRKPTDRADFAETLYWNTGVKTDATTGEATINFGLNDSVTTFRVFADAFSSAGAIGAANVGVQSVQPFYAEAKLPLEVTAGDHVLLPITLINATTIGFQHPGLNIELKGDFKIQKLLEGKAVVNANERVRWIQPIDIGFENGTKELILNATGGSYADRVTRKLSVKPAGFPTESAFGGVLEPGKPVSHTITIPEGVVARSIITNTAVYPSPLANLTEALQRMIQDPSGCFEQTSSTSYPLTMAQQYFLSHTGIDPKLVETSREKLDTGYKMLVGFWCPDKGYEWFGENPGHEALTAFGLLHFTDMEQVRDVDRNMVASTRAWLLKQKDGQGGFSRKRRALHTWIEDKDCSNAYIIWALLETGQPSADLKPEIDSLKKAADASQNYYVVALAANVLELSGDKAGAKKLMDRLVAKQKPDGSLDGVTSSIVGSGGESLVVEGTAFATLAWLREPAYAGSVEKSIKFLADSCKDGRYGSTQATVLALRSIITYDKQQAHPKAPGKVEVLVDGQTVGDWINFDKSTKGALKLPELSELLTPGTHKVELRMDGGGPMPYALAVKYNSLKPNNSNDCKLDISTKMAQAKVAEGASTEADVTVINKTKDVVPNPVAVIGLPGGLEPRIDQLKELVKKGKIDAYEVRGREIVLYWRTLAGDAKVQIPLSLIAAIPGTYTGPASRAYLYYTDENKKWVDGMHIEIAAK